MNTNRKRALIAIGVVFFLAVVGLIAYFAWINIVYVDTLHARVEGPIAQVRAPATGRVAEVPLEVGDAVAEQDELLLLEAVGGGTGQFPVTRMLLPVRAPMAGVVTDKLVREGDGVSMGQALVTLVDPQQLWITATIHESRIQQVQVGQRVRIWISMRTVRNKFWGRVELVGRATQTALAAGRVTDATGTRLSEVPVRISFDPAGYELYPGMTAEVRIRLSPRLW